MNDETRDHALSRLYREGAWPEPSRQIDQAILAASRRASRERHPFLWRFAPAFAVAATVVLTSAIVLKVYREQPDMLASPVQEKSTEALRAKVAEAKQKEAEQKPQESRPAAPAPEPQVPATPQGFSSTMDMAESARLERAQRDLGLKEPSPAGAPATAKAAPAARAAAPQPLKKEASAPVEANRERRADAPQTSTFSAFGASAPPAQTPQPPPAPSPAARATTGKPAQIVTQSAPPAAPSAEAAPASQAQAQGSPSGSASVAALQAAPAKAERTPQAWIDEIRKMMKEGKSEEAGEEIAKFKKRYPDYVLPEDLR
jgi:hypothetical protein